MKRTLLALSVFALAGWSCTTASVYTVKVLKHDTDYFAQWGERDGKPFEDRYDAILCEVFDKNKKVADLAVYQHWFKQDRKEYPPEGSEITIKAYRFRDQMFGPGVYTMELDEFEKLKIR